MSDALPVGTKPPSTFLPAKSWQHFLAGGYGQTVSSSSSQCLRRSFVFTTNNRLGGMCGAIVTSPFDVVKTRLQSDLFQEKQAKFGVVGGGVVIVPRRTGLLWNFVETGHILRSVMHQNQCSNRHVTITLSTQRYISRRITPRPLQRARPNPRWRHPSTIHQLLHVRKREADHRGTLQ